MTNTGDFRRYSYSSDASYALKAFDVSRSSAAPAYTPNTKKDLKVREGKGNRKSKKQLINEQKIGFGRILTIITVSLLSLSMLFGVLYTYAKKNELNHEISNLQNQLSVAQSENTRINSELNALVSMNMIEKYAVDELGMTKIRKGQAIYIDSTKFMEQYKNAPEFVQEQLTK